MRNDESRSWSDRTDFRLVQGEELSQRRQPCGMAGPSQGGAAGTCEGGKGRASSRAFIYRGARHRGSVAHARGNSCAGMPDRQLRYEARDLIKRLPDEVIREHVRDYVCGVLSETPKGLKRTYAAGRDGYIAEAVYDATRRGFPPTRNAATRGKESACSLVAKALARVGVNLSERTVEDI